MSDSVWDNMPREEFEAIITRKKPRNYMKNGYKALRLEMIAAYGGKCSCCDEVHEEFLTLEHINHDGKEHRKRVGHGVYIYLNLKKRGWPQNGFTVLCMNCNWATRFKKPCPHWIDKTAKKD